MFLKKKRPEKLKAVRFLLTPRPQRDPLAADFEAPINVLVPADGSDIDQITERLRDFDPKVFPSKEETKVGMLERAHAANNVTIDNDVLKAMSQDFDYDDPNNILDDDFMDQAGGLIEDEGELLDSEFMEDESGLFEEEVMMYKNGPFSNDEPKKDVKEGNLKAPSNDNDSHEETKSIFSNYSMTSSVMRRSAGLQQIDEHFERLYEKDYADDNGVESSDSDDVHGEDPLENMDQIRQMKKEIKVVRQRNHGDDYEPEIVTDHHKNAIIGDDSNEEDLVETEMTKHESRVDCESILTFNSSLYNHPRLIIEPRKRNTSQSTLTSEMINNSDDDDARSRSDSRSIASSRATILSKLSTRPDNETAEERRARKKALKKYRQERRKERKQNQQIFKTEQANLIKQQRANLPALKLA